MDKFSKAKRTEIMSKVRHKNTKPELVLRRLLHANGFRFRLHKRDLPGTPDLFLRKYNAAIFVHGCFWHGHSCSRGKLPNTRREFWAQKIEGNKKRDEESIMTLQKMGIRTFVVWECELKKKSNILDKVIKFLRQGNENGP